MKGNRILYFVIIIIISCSAQFDTRALGENDYFLYEIIEAGHTLKVGEQLITNNEFGSMGYPVGTIVNTTFESLVSSGVEFKCWIEERYWISFYYVDRLDQFGMIYSMMSLFTTYEMIENFHDGYLVDLSLYKIYPYFDPEKTEYIATPETFIEEINSTFAREAYPDIECLFNYTKEKNVLYFESWVGGKVEGSFGKVINGKEKYQSDISFSNSFHFNINMTSGIVNGFGIKGWVQGMIEKKEIDMTLACEYKLKGYEFQDYLYGNVNYGKEKKMLIILSSTLIPTILVSSAVAGTIKYKKTKAGMKRNCYNE